MGTILTSTPIIAVSTAVSSFLFMTIASLLLLWLIPHTHRHHLRKVGTYHHELCHGIASLATRLSSLSNLGENSNLARLTAEALKRIARSRAGSELFAPAADSSLLDFSSASGPSAKEAADAYLEGVSQRGVVQSRQEPLVPSNSLLEGID